MTTDELDDLQTIEHELDSIDNGYYDDHGYHP